MASKENDRKTPLPPYIPWRTFENFIQRLHDTIVPEIVDSSMLRSYSGSVARQVVAALKFLRLITSSGHTTDALNRLAKSYGTAEWQAHLTDAIFAAYNDLIGDLNLDTATHGQLENKFKLWGADGQVLAKCVNFYMAALRATGTTFSPLIGMSQRNKSDAPRKPRAKPAASTKQNSPEDGVPAVTPSGTVKFAFPVPGRQQNVTLFIPADITADDWQMVDAMVTAYINRMAKSVN